MRPLNKEDAYGSRDLSSMYPWVGVNPSLAWALCVLPELWHGVFSLLHSYISPPAGLHAPRAEPGSDLIHFYNLHNQRYPKHQEGLEQLLSWPAFPRTFRAWTIHCCFSGFWSLASFPSFLCTSQSTRKCRLIFSLKFKLTRLWQLGYEPLGTGPWETSFGES